MKQILFAFLCLWLIGCKKDTPEKDKPANIVIEINPTETSTSYAAASKIIMVDANANWQLTSNAAWCSVSPTNGTPGTTGVTITIDENKSSVTVREALLTFTSGTYTKTHLVKQQIFVEPITIADAAFRAYCLANLDVNNDQVISLAEAQNIKTLNIQGLGIASLSGIEHFSSLTSLNCSNNALTTIDISKLSKLTTLNCANNQLTELSIATNVNLTALDCSGNSALATIQVWTGFVATASFVKPAAAEFKAPEINTPMGYSLVWQDEFNTPRKAGGKPELPNTALWWYETGANGWGNNEIQNYVSGFKNADTCAAIYDGTLKIILKKTGSEVLSVRMNTSASWTYGYFEARMKLPPGKGTWPAFWMMPKNFTAWPKDGEIDIMEHVGYRPNYIHSSVHTQAYYHSIGTQKTAERYVSTAQSEFHVYAVEWTADYVKGFVDGVNYFTFNNDKTGNYDTWPFFKPFYLKLNMAWGGNWGGAQGVDETALPATFEIDYVRVFQKN